MNDHKANVPLWPKELNKIYKNPILNKGKSSRILPLTVAIGCPIGLFNILCVSVPMQNASTTFKPISTCQTLKQLSKPTGFLLPHPITTLEVVARMIA